MSKSIRNLVDEALGNLESKQLNCIPGAVPKPMQTGEVQDDWVQWRAVESTVTEQEIVVLEKLLGVRLPPQYRELLQYKHFLELPIGEASVFAHPIDIWKSRIVQEVFCGYPREFLIDKGYLPFANYSDWGLLCFHVTEQDADGEYAVYLWDHERPEKFEFFASDLRVALNREATAKS